MLAVSFALFTAVLLCSEFYFKRMLIDCHYMTDRLQWLKIKIKKSSFVFY